MQNECSTTAELVEAGFDKLSRRTSYPSKIINFDTFGVKIRVNLRKSAYKIPNSERCLK